MEEELNDSTTLKIILKLQKKIKRVVVDNDEICNKARYIELTDHFVASATKEHIT